MTEKEARTATTGALAAMVGGYRNIKMHKLIM